jgi:hypothetical protein
MTVNYRTLPNGETVASTDELPQMLMAEEGLPPKAFRAYGAGRRAAVDLSLASLAKQSPS